MIGIPVQNVGERVGMYLERLADHYGIGDLSDMTLLEFSMAVTLGEAAKAHDSANCDPEAGKPCPYCRKMGAAEQRDAARIWAGMRQAGMTGDPLTDEASMRDAGRMR